MIIDYACCAAVSDCVCQHDDSAEGFFFTRRCVVRFVYWPRWNVDAGKRFSTILLTGSASDLTCTLMKCCNMK